MIGEKCDMFWRFTKMKPLILYDVESIDAYEFINDYHERLHKMEVVEKYGVGFVTFQLLEDARLWWQVFLECRPIGLLPLTWTQFYSIVLGKYVPRTL